MKILIVDDSKTDLLLLKNLLHTYQTITASDGIEAMEVLAKNLDVKIMILDLNMPRMNGFEVLAEMKKNPIYSKISVLILTNYDEIENEIRGLELGAVDYVRKPLNIQSLLKRIDLHVNLKNAYQKLEDQNVHLENMVMEKTLELHETRNITIQAMVGLLEIRNIESSNHTIRTQWMMKALSSKLQEDPRYEPILTSTYMDNLFHTSPLHDIGKVGIPDEILLKPGKLTPDEYEKMKLHTIYGINALKQETILNKTPEFIATAIEIVGSHHEKYNGSGYPYGLSGTEIPLSARLMAIIDVYDALASERVYKPAYPHEVAIEIMSNDCGTHFDPDLFTHFLTIEKEIQTIHDTFQYKK